MDGRIQKQLIVGIIFILILSGIGYVVFDKFFLIESTCFDNVQNGKEEGVDCGTLACGIICSVPIQDLQIQTVQTLSVADDTDGTTDVAIRVYNPNAEYGASLGSYDLVIRDPSGIEIDRLTGNKFYILPGQTKYLILTAVKGLALGYESVEIKSVEWEKLNVPDNTISFVLKRNDYHAIQTGTELNSVLYNNSNYDFDKVDVAVILFDDAGIIVGVGKTDIRTFVSKSERGFNIVWPFALSGNVVKQDVEVSTNLFENSNFIKSYGSQEKFQKFY